MLGRLKVETSGRTKDLDGAVQKASLLLDLKGNRQEAVRVLEHALLPPVPVEPSAVRALVFLAELHLETNPEEARRHLESALSMALNPGWDDTVEPELTRARHLLEMLPPAVAGC